MNDDDGTEYLKKKLFDAIKVPPEYLGYEPGYGWAPYVPVIREIPYIDINYEVTKSIKTRYAKSTIRPEYYGKIEVGGTTSFTLPISPEPKPVFTTKKLRAKWDVEFQPLNTSGGISGITYADHPGLLEDLQKHLSEEMTRAVDEAILREERRLYGHEGQIIIDDLVQRTNVQINVVSTPSVQIDYSRFPHLCPRCKAPAFIGFMNVECSQEGCR
jgi:hypothetical protein